MLAQNTPQTSIYRLQTSILQNPIQFYQIKLNKSQKKMGKIYKTVHQEDEDYDPKSKTESKFREYKPKSKEFFVCNSNKWTLEQNLMFLSFLKRQKAIIGCQKNRKQTKVFVRLSAQIKTRTPDQCRSHHQKMIKHHNDIDGIIEYLENKRTTNSQLNENDQDTLGNQQSLQQQKIENISNFQQKQIHMRQINDENMVVEEECLWNIINRQVWIVQEQRSNQI